MNQSLSWGLVIATYQREQVLLQCLKLAAEQTRKPVEIIVVDASNQWKTTYDKLMSEIAPMNSEIRWVYVPATQRGLPLQRNQGLELATADIVFMIDDDSLMFPTCAEEIMRVYEADTEGSVMGVQASLTGELPSDVSVNDSRKRMGSGQDPWLMETPFLLQFIWKHFFLMNNEMLCVPYDGSFPSYAAPAQLTAMQSFPVRLFHGCRMTFRREIISREKFEPLLLYYALNEDMDASYRVSRHGMLLESGRAKLHHFQSNSGRLSRFVVSALSVLNQAVCVRRYSNDLKRDRVRLYWLTTRRVVAEGFKDTLSRRWTFPQARGILVGLQQVPHILSMPENELTEWYPRFQQEFMNSGQSSKTDANHRVQEPNSSK